MRRARAHQSRAVFFAALLLLASCGESEKATERRRQAIEAFGALQQPAIDAEASLRGLANDANLEIGTAIDGFQFSDPKWRDIVAREFNQVTVNWGLYWGVIEPTRGEFDFSVVDHQIELAESIGMTIRGHPLVFASAHPDWLNEPDWSDEELLEVLHHHITQIVSRYKNRIHQWVVVNEPSCTAARPRRRAHSIWEQAAGNAERLWNSCGPFNPEVEKLNPDSRWTAV